MPIEVLVFILVTIFVTMVLSIRRVKGGNRLVIFRLGRFHRIADPGITFIAPMIDRGIVADLKKTIPDYHEGLPRTIVNERLKAHFERGPASPAEGTEAPPPLDPELKRFAEWLIDQAEEQTGAPVRSDPMAITRLEQAAMQTRDALALKDTHKISLPFLAAEGSEPKHFVLDVSKEEFSRRR